MMSQMKIYARKYPRRKSSGGEPANPREDEDAEHQEQEGVPKQDLGD